MVVDIDPSKVTGGNINRFLCIVTYFAIMAAPSITICLAQGSIFGTVENSDLSTPANGEIYFIGFLDNTDEEIRIESCIGAGYDSGHWYDDFQNYLTEAPGNPYNYYFFNPTNGEAAALAKTIPDNSFQREDIQLVVMTYPSAPSALSGKLVDDSAIQISWNYGLDFTYRIYRRETGSEGSFFRIDDIAGSLSNPGVGDSTFIDSSVNHIAAYDYMIIPINGTIFGLHSGIISVSSNPNYFLCGDADDNNVVDIADVMFIIDYLYLGGGAPSHPESADTDGRPGLNILDVAYILRYLYFAGSVPDCN